MYWTSAMTWNWNCISGFRVLKWRPIMWIGIFFFTFSMYHYSPSTLFFFSECLSRMNQNFSLVMHPLFGVRLKWRHPIFACLVCVTAVLLFVRLSLFEKMKMMADFICRQSMPASSSKQCPEQFFSLFVNLFHVAAFIVSASVLRKHTKQNTYIFVHPETMCLTF